jgi:hypothetical protein
MGSRSPGKQPQRKRPAQMSARPQSGAPSHILHSGFVDLANLITSTPSRLIPASRRWSNQQPSPNRVYKQGGRKLDDEPWDLAGVPYERHVAKENTDPSDRLLPPRGGPAGRGGRAGGVARGGMAAGGRADQKHVELRRRRVDKRMIGPPTDFR